MKITGFITMKTSGGYSYELRTNRAVCISYDNITNTYDVYNGFKKVGNYNTLDAALIVARNI